MLDVTKLSKVSALLVIGTGLLLTGTILFAFTGPSEEVDPARILGAACIPLGALLLCAGLFFCTCTRLDFRRLKIKRTASLMDYYDDCWTPSYGAPPSYEEAVTRTRTCCDGQLLCDKCGERQRMNLEC